MSARSFLISFEGIESSGKSSQIERVREFLQARGFSVHCLREPGGTTFGEQLRKAILQSKEKLDPLAELYLFASSRAQLLRQETLPKLKKPNTVVIYDRFVDSTLAYQGHAGGVGL